MWRVTDQPADGIQEALHLQNHLIQYQVEGRAILVMSHPVGILVHRRALTGSYHITDHYFNT